MVVMASLSASVQGMDEAVINGAQLIYPAQFGINTSTCTFMSSLDLIVILMFAFSTR